MISTIQVAGQPVTLVAMPPTPGFRSVEFSFDDGGSEFVSPFTGMTQVLQWPGADMLSGTMTLPSMVQSNADAWLAFLMECRGKANGFMLGNPTKQQPAGNIGNSVPVFDNSVSGGNGAMAQTLYTKGWDVSTALLLLPGDYVQVGVRLHVNLEPVTSDAYGKAALQIWPSLREGAPADVEGVAQPLILNNPQGLFRRADTKATWSATGGAANPITSLSFRVEEYR